MRIIFNCRKFELIYIDMYTGTGAIHKHSTHIHMQKLATTCIVALAFVSSIASLSPFSLAPLPPSLSLFLSLSLPLCPMTCHCILFELFKESKWPFAQMHVELLLTLAASSNHTKTLKRDRPRTSHQCIRHKHIRCSA